VVASVVVEVHGSPQDEEVVFVDGLESEEGGGGEVGVLGWGEDGCVSFVNI
jgi:hypothetical protein